MVVVFLTPLFLSFPLSFDAPEPQETKKWEGEMMKEGILLSFFFFLLFFSDRGERTVAQQQTQEAHKERDLTAPSSSFSFFFSFFSSSSSGSCRESGKGSSIVGALPFFLFTFSRGPEARRVAVAVGVDAIGVFSSFLPLFFPLFPLLVKKGGKLEKRRLLSPSSFPLPVSAAPSPVQSQPTSEEKREERVKW